MSVLSDDMKALVRRTRLGFVATLNDDGSPHLAHFGTLTVWDDDHLVYANIRSPRTTANIARGSLTVVEVVDQFARRGYRFRGIGTSHAGDTTYDDATAMYAQDYELPAERILTVVRIHVDEARAVRSPAYDEGQSEAELVTAWRTFYSA